MDREHRILRAHRGARVDHALASALHLGVAALHAVEVERLVVGAGHHGRRRAAAKADAHRRPADLHYVRARLHGLLLHLVADDHSMASRKHYRLVVAAILSRHVALIRAEEAGELRTAELVSERRPAYRTLRHDLKRRREPLRELSVYALPRLRRAGDVKVAHHEAADARV